MVRKKRGKRIIQISYPQFAPGGAAVVDNGGAVPPSELVFDFDSDTVGQQPSILAIEHGNINSDVISESIEGHTKVVRLDMDASNNCAPYFDLGENYNYSQGIKIQVLFATEDITKFNCECVVSDILGASFADSSSQRLYAYYSQGNNPDTLQGAVTDGGVLQNNTGADSTGYDGTSPAWHYMRFQFRLLNSFFGAFLTIAGANADGSPFASTWDTQPSVLPNNLRYIGFRSQTNWFGVKIAEIWVAPDSTAWPTAGEPQG